LSSLGTTIARCTLPKQSPCQQYDVTRLALL
jgi:hypothetical protein